MPPIYSLDDTIDNFFRSHQHVTRRQCDELAISLIGGPVNPVPIQGMFSYTVVAGAEQSTIIQFRAQIADLDTKILDLARLIHGKIVAAYIHHGQIGQSSPLSIYVMEKLPGSPYIQAESSYCKPVWTSLQSSPQHANTVADFAVFFAQAWNRAQTLAPDVAQAVHSDYQCKLELLSGVLPHRFTKILRNARAELPTLFTSSYPMVLSHGDLREMNILVNPTTGHITGVVDWAEAKILPFGVSLWGLENVLGYMDSQRWHYHSIHRALEDLFWQTFERNVGGVSDTDKQVIQIARVLGCFLRYGFSWAGADGEVPVTEEGDSLKYLDAFCVTGDQSA